MASVNKAIILGNLGNDPDLRYTPSGAAVCTLSVATTDVRMDKEGNRQELTEWHRVVVWNKQAENCAKYLAKGRPVFVEGRIQTKSWEDKSGQKRYTTEIVAERVQFLGGRDTQPNQGSNYSSGSNYSGGQGSQGNNSNRNDKPSSGQDNQSFGSMDTPDLDDIPF